MDIVILHIQTGKQVDGLPSVLNLLASVSKGTTDEAYTFLLRPRTTVRRYVRSSISQSVSPLIRNPQQK